MLLNRPGRLLPGSGDGRMRGRDSDRAEIWHSMGDGGSKKDGGNREDEDQLLASYNNGETILWIWLI